MPIGGGGGKPIIEPGGGGSAPIGGGTVGSSQLSNIGGGRSGSPPGMPIGGGGMVGSIDELKLSNGDATSGGGGGRLNPPLGDGRAAADVLSSCDDEKVPDSATGRSGCMEVEACGSTLRPPYGSCVWYETWCGST